MSFKFKKGDKVRLTKHRLCSITNKYLHNIGTIKCVPNNMPLVYEVYFEGYGQSVWFESSLELAIPHRGKQYLLFEL